MAPRGIGRFLATALSLTALLAGSSSLLGETSNAYATSTAHTTDNTPSAMRWHGTWRAAPQQPFPSGTSHAGMKNQTVRMVVHSSVGGSALRVRLSNAYGTRPVLIGKVDVASHQTGPVTVANTDHMVTFNGRKSVMIPVGQEVVSDPVQMSVRDEQDLVVSVFLPKATGPTTWHFEAESTTYTSTPGDWTAEAGGSPYQTEIPSWFYLDGIDVMRRPLKGTVLAFGDSITDGHFSTIDANGRWPDWLARRISPGQQFSVLDEGIGGNRVLTDSPTAGESALHRFHRDMLNQIGVSDVIFLEGINDIGVGNTTGPYVSADQLAAGMKKIIAEAHARDLKVFGGTVTPFQGAAYYTAAGEAEREAVNKWIRTSGAFDGVIDFDAAVRDPNHPLRLNPLYDTGGGHLHPNDLGYKAMADAINLSLLTGRTHQISKLPVGGASTGGGGSAAGVEGVGLLATGVALLLLGATGLGFLGYRRRSVEG